MSCRPSESLNRILESTQEKELSFRPGKLICFAAEAHCIAKEMCFTTDTEREIVIHSTGIRWDQFTTPQPSIRDRFTALFADATTDGAAIFYCDCARVQTGFLGENLTTWIVWKWTHVGIRHRYNASNYKCVETFDFLKPEAFN
mmetsp:Transcript_42577/g.68574  ORF Transcript_42577/g.68574 Transcript_42577/m.68574 type:complete len:144 (-) Transcript_42577:57-488(-)